MTLIKNLALGFLALVLLLISWGLLEPYVIDETPITALLPRLPESWEGQQVAVIADLQVGMWLANTLTVQQIVSRLVQTPPTLVLVAGDFIYHPGQDGSAQIAKAAELLRPLTEAKIPTYAVLGNHDYAMPTETATKNEAVARALRTALETAGIRVLQNQAVPLAAPGGGTSSTPLYLIGIGSHVAKEDSPQDALEGLPESALRLVVMHHPESFKAFPAGAAPSAVAAHTHGGQFRIPFLPSRTWMSYAREDDVHADGWIDNYGAAGNRLYVNRGIGFSVLPLRLNCPPELTLLTLRRS